MFGRYKKLKDWFKKGKSWIQKVLPKAREVIKTAAEIVPKITPNEKVKNLLDFTSSGIEAADEAINNHNYNDGINWINHEIPLRLKRRTLNFEN